MSKIWCRVDNTLPPRENSPPVKERELEPGVIEIIPVDLVHYSNWMKNQKLSLLLRRNGTR